jgi:hypothetical protein
MECSVAAAGFCSADAGTDEFRRNLHESGIFSLSSMYKALI